MVHKCYADWIKTVIYQVGGGGDGSCRQTHTRLLGVDPQDAQVTWVL